MQNAAVEGGKAGKFGDARRREMVRGDDDMVEDLGIHAVLDEVMHADSEFGAGRIVGDKADGCGLADPVADPGLGHAAFDIVEQHGARG